MSGYSLVFVIADVVNALLIRSIGKNLRISYNQRLRSLGLDTISKVSGTSICKDASFWLRVGWESRVIVIVSC